MDSNRLFYKIQRIKVKLDIGVKFTKFKEAVSKDGLFILL